MSSAAPTIQSPHDPHKLGRGHGGHDSGGTGSGGSGPASKRIITGYGFWIFLLSDIVLFSAVFATYAVLQGSTDGCPTAMQLFDLHNVAIETVCLLLSSFACGLAMIAAKVENQLWTQVGLLVTGLLGAAFLLLEFRE